MDSQEREALSRFLGQLTEVRLAEKDHEAEDLIRDAVARQPDAAYLLVQRAMLVEQALTRAKSRIAELQQDRRPPASAGGFLAGRNPWAPPSDPVEGPAPVPGAGAYRIPAAAASVGAGPATGGGSFLGNVATTAAGVVAGSFLFQGLESLLGHHHGMNAAWNDPAGEHLADQTIVNNYYGSAPAELADADTGPDPDAFLAGDPGGGYADDGGDDSDWI